MFAAHIPTQDPDSIRLIFLLIATGMVVFWRTVLKLAAIAVVLLAVLGTLALLQGLHP
jgi:hypothetical protein